MKINVKWPEHVLKFSKKNNELNMKSNISNLANDTSSDIFCEKKEKLNALLSKMKNEKRIIFFDQANNLVFGDGNINSKLMFIGEAPGEEEDLKGLPFVGKSGQLLRFFLKEANINDFYITNIVPWRPPKNRTPTDEEIEIMKPYILEHIKIISPAIIIPVGTTALKTLGIQQTITKAQSNLLKNDIGNIYPIYHPSYALRVMSKKKELWISLLKLTTLYS